MQNNTRLRIATRIHFALLRHLGEGIDVGNMLRRDAEAREVLWVCHASGDAELMALAHQYQRAVELEKEPLHMGGHKPQETHWSKNTSGFGLSQPPEAVAPPTMARTTPSRSWLKLASWFHR